MAAKVCFALRLFFIAGLTLGLLLTVCTNVNTYLAERVGVESSQELVPKQSFPAVVICAKWPELDKESVNAKVMDENNIPIPDGEAHIEWQSFWLIDKACHMFRTQRTGLV